MLGRATIRLGIGPHSSLGFDYVCETKFCRSERTSFRAYLYSGFKGQIDQLIASDLSRSRTDFSSSDSALSSM